MARHRSHSIGFKRQIAQKFNTGESLYALAKRHDLSRQFVRVWTKKYEPALLTKTLKLPICSRNAKPRLCLWSAWLAGRRSRSSF